MPKRPKHPCSHPGCPRLTDYRFCEEHEKLHNKENLISLCKSCHSRIHAKRGDR